MKCIFNITINHEMQDNPDYLNELLNVFLFSDSVFDMRLTVCDHLKCHFLKMSIKLVEKKEHFKSFYKKQRKKEHAADVLKFDI